MNKLSYRVILHGPMSWKTSHQLSDQTTNTPYLVVFEPISSLVIVSQGTSLIPKIPVYLDNLNSQILSVFLYNDPSLAKQLVSELYNYLDRNLTIFEVYKNDNIVKLLTKSLSTFHLPLEVVLKKVDYSNLTRPSSTQSNTFSLSSYRPGLKRNLTLFNPYENLSQRLSRDPTYNLNLKISNTVTNNILNYNFDTQNKFYRDEPKSVKNANEHVDSYNLRVGLEEGFYMLTTSTDLMKKLYQCTERKGPRVNRLSLSFYKIRKADVRDDVNMYSNTLNNSSGLSVSKSLLYRNNTTLTYKKTLKDMLESNRCLQTNVKHLNKSININADYKFTKNPGFYTPGFVSTPILSNTGVCKNNSTLTCKNDGYDLVNGNLSHVIRSLTAAIDKNTEALNQSGSLKGSNSCSHRIDSNGIDKIKMGFNDTKPTVISSANNHGLVSMSTSEFFGYSSPTSNCNSNNFNNRNYSLLSDNSPDYHPSKLNQGHGDELKLDDFRLKPFCEGQTFILSESNNFITSTSDVENNVDAPETGNYDSFVQNYVQVLEKLNEVETMYDLEDVKKKFNEKSSKSSEVTNNSSLKEPKNLQNENSKETKTNVVLSSRSEEKLEHSTMESDCLTEFTDETERELEQNEYSQVREVEMEEYENDKIGAKLNNSYSINSISNNEKNTTFRDDEEYKSDVESNIDELSTKSDLNVLMDEFNELSTKNELLSRDNSKYRNKILRLKDKIKNIKSLHKYELEDVMNTNYSNEEKLRSTISDNNVTLKMMEQERLKLTDMLEQHKMIIKRLNREKLEAVQQLSRLEDEFNKLQLVREMDKSEKYSYNKTKLEVEQLKADNEVLNNKLRVANEKIFKMQHNEKVKNETVKELKEKLEIVEEDKLKNDQLLNEIRVLKTKEAHLKEKLDLIKKDHSSLRNEYNEQKNNNIRLADTNQDLKEELKRARSLLHDYENKDDKLESKLAMLESNNTVLLKNLESSKNELDKVKALLENAYKEKASVESKYHQLQSSVEKVEYMNNTLSTELQDIKRSMDIKNNENETLIQLLSERENELSHLKNQSTLTKESHAQLMRENGYLRSSYETLEASYKKFQKYDEGMRSQYQLKSEQNDELLRQLQEFKMCMDKYKDDMDLKTTRQKDMYCKLVARFFMLSFKYTKLQKENSINKIKLIMTEHRNKSMLIRRLMRTVLLSKAKIAKRNCQILSIVGALQMTGPTTCSMIISRINTLVAATSQNSSKSHDKIAQLKSSFMKHSIEKDQMIKVLQTKLISMDQLKENQQFLLEENRNLSDQIMAEQNNSQKLQQALNEQIERERFAFESESKSLYSRQYQLLKENEQLSKENYSLKESLTSLLQTSKHSHEPEYMTDVNNNIFDVKYEKVKNIYNSVQPNELNQSRYLSYFNSPSMNKYKSDFEDALSMKTRDQYPGMVYHRV